MVRSSDSGQYFQTSASLADSKRKDAKRQSQAGRPIQLESKLNAVITDPRDGESVFVAGSDGAIRKVNAMKRSVTMKYTGPQAPLTSLALSPSPKYQHRKHAAKRIFAGCWDEKIYLWDLEKSTCLQQYTGHSDFVKCLTTCILNSAEILLSGGGEGNIIVWNIDSGEKLHILNGYHTRGVLDIAIDPISLRPPFMEGEVDQKQSVIFWTAGTDRKIRRFHLSGDKASPYPIDAEAVGNATADATATEDDSTLIVHETSVNRLYFPEITIDDDGLNTPHDDTNTTPDLFTASSDKSARQLSRKHTFQSTGNTIQPLIHPDFVRDILVHQECDVIVTACRDENVRFWDAEDGALLWNAAGHWEEVTALCVLDHVEEDDGPVVVSVSIDGSVRSWPLSRDAIQKAKQKAEEDERKAAADRTNGSKKPETKMTEEEERELAELMEEDSD